MWKKLFLKDVDKRVPGPSPWYLRAPWRQIESAEGKWAWDFYEGQELSGVSRLISPAGQTVLILDFYCYVQPLTEDRLLVWHEAGRSEPEPSDNPRIVFTILSLPKLVPISDPDSVALEMRKQKLRIRFDRGEPAMFECPTTHYEESFTIDAPEQYQELGEILVLADYGPADTASNHFDTMRRAIFCCDFSTNRATVLPQDWFNKGSYDFGYQWITRVQRDPRSKKIFGEGIRLGSFRLDRSGTKIGKWVRHDAFFHPEF